MDAYHALHFMFGNFFWVFLFFLCFSFFPPWFSWFIFVDFEFFKTENVVILFLFLLLFPLVFLVCFC